MPSEGKTTERIAPKSVIAAAVASLCRGTDIQELDVAEKVIALLGRYGYEIRSVQSDKIAKRPASTKPAGRDGNHQRSTDAPAISRGQAVA